MSNYYNQNSNNSNNNDQCYSFQPQQQQNSTYIENKQFNSNLTTQQCHQQQVCTQTYNNYNKYNNQFNPNQNIQFQSENFNNEHYSNRNFRCNFASCIECQGNSAENIIKEIKWRKKQENQKENNNNFKSQLSEFKNRKKKFCTNFDCVKCQKIIYKISSAPIIDDETFFTEAMKNHDGAKLESTENSKISEIGVNNENITLSCPEEVIIKASKLEEYCEICVDKDGNCFFKCLAKIAGLNDYKHKDFRRATADGIQKSDLTIVELVEGETNISKEMYVENLKKSGVYATYTELLTISKITNIAFAVYLQNNRYGTKVKWQIIRKNENEKPLEYVFLILYQGESTSKNESAHHYNPLFKKEYDNIIKNQLMTFANPTEPENQSLPNFKTLVFNARSITDNIKKAFITDELYTNQTDIAFIIETFLREDEAWYVKGYRIFRSNNILGKRKGVAILVSNKINGTIKILTNDRYGRYIKLEIRDKESNSRKTLSAIYLEPPPLNEPYDLNLIPDEVMDSDYIAGDLNKANSTININGIFHTKNISNCTIEKLPNHISDHGLMRGILKMQLSKIDIEDEITIIDKKTSDVNLKTLRNILNKQLPQEFKDAKRKIRINRETLVASNANYVENWKEIIEENKMNNLKFSKDKLSTLDRMFKTGAIEQSSWAKLNSLLHIKRKSKIWIPEGNKKEMIQGFKQLYCDNGEEKKCKSSEMLGFFRKIIGMALEVDSMKERSSLFIPKSNARDQNGFSQKEIAKLIKSENAHQDIINFQNLIEGSYKCNNKGLFLHRTSKLILFKKVDLVSSWKDLRGISIFPSALIILEKLCLPIVKQVSHGSLHINQFGFRDSSDINIAKVSLAYQAHQRNLNKALLIDVQKAYDSVNLDLLKDIINEKYQTEPAKFLTSFIDIYQKLNINMLEEIINPRIGIPQGSTIGPLLFFIYINGILGDMCKNHIEINIQAFVDDLIIQGKSIEAIQCAFDDLISQLKKLQMKINPRKCELISHDELDFIIDDESQETIPAKSSARYLGQQIDSHGNPSYTITKNSLGKMIGVINSCSCLSRRTRIRIFKIYIRSAIGHLIPLISLSGKASQSWTAVRSIIFRNVLKGSTLPRESASLFKIGFFDIMIKPLLRTIERDQFITNDQGQTDFLKSAIKPLLLEWSNIEENLTPKIKQMIIQACSENVYYNSWEWEKEVRKEAATRLFRNSINQNLSLKLENLTEPNIVFFLSNAPSHIIKERTLRAKKRTMKSNIMKKKRRLKE